MKTSFSSSIVILLFLGFLYYRHKHRPETDLSDLRSRASGPRDHPSGDERETEEARRRTAAPL